MSRTHRMHTRVVAIVHSHLNDEEPIHLSPDVIGMRCSKTVKGSGGMSLDLVPRRNYFNHVYPNDVINVYVDPGDGKRGFVRLFMGYVDRVERTENTDENGGISTVFRIVCTDFQKAFDRTHIYFNPHLANRTDLVDETLGMSLLAGHALRVRGVRAHGTPADMVENFATMLLGFGSQWVLPKAYNTGSKLIKDNRQRRRNRAKARLPDDLLKALAILNIPLPELQNTDDIEQLINNRLGSDEEERDFVFRTALTGAQQSALKGGILSLNSFQTNARGTVSDTYSILDLVDFSFIENAAIDGYISSQAVWTQSGMLTSMMKAFSNEIVNELIFDLRPIARDSIQGSTSELLVDSCFGREYSREPDDLGINVNGISDSEAFRASVPAVAYAPAIVFREYPFSCTEGLDLTKLQITDSSTGGFVPFGPVFPIKKDSDEGTNAGQYRAIYNYLDVEEVASGGGTLSPSGCELAENTAPLKHLDVVTIKDTDVISSSIGRSDNDVFNLFAMYATDSLQKVYKYLLKSFMPITNSVSIARNGLRVHEVKTRFANYSRDKLCDGSSAVHSSAIIRNMIRWMLLMDHWNQHNNEYLSGEITLRGMPEIRVGYRLDWESRRESYYVESVSHNWAYPKVMTTTVSVSRGQRNDPFPVYIPPKLTRAQDTRLAVKPDSTVIINQEDNGATTATRFDLFGGVSDLGELSTTLLKGGGNRNSDGRLAQYFRVLNTPATHRSTQADTEALAVPLEGIDDNLVDRFPSLFSGAVEYSGEGIKSSRETDFTASKGEFNDNIGSTED